MRWLRRVAVGLVGLNVVCGCAEGDVTSVGPGPATGPVTATIPADDVDASTPPDAVDASGDAGDAASESQDAGSSCAPLSPACPFLRCQDRDGTLAGARSRCERPPFIRSVTQAAACGRSVVAYRYGASDTTVVFFDAQSGELRGWWNESDTAAIDCAGEVDLACARSVEASLPAAGGCRRDAGGADARAPDSGS